MTARRNTRPFSRDGDSQPRGLAAAALAMLKSWSPQGWTVVASLWAGAVALAVATVASVLVDARVYGADGGALSQSKMSMAGFLLMAVCGLALIEQVYRNSRREYRWSLKYLLLGLGALFVYDLYLYSTGVLFGDLEPVVWAARGLVQALVLPFLVVAARRNPQWSLEVFISRQVAFHTAAFMGCGVYLVVMAAAGYWIRDFGGTWGAFAQGTVYVRCLCRIGSAVLLWPPPLQVASVPGQALLSQQI